MIVIGVLIGTNVAHTRLATSTVLEALHIRILILIVHTTGRNIDGLDSFKWSLSFACLKFEQVLRYSLHSYFLSVFL